MRFETDGGGGGRGARGGAEARGGREREEVCWIQLIKVKANEARKHIVRVCVINTNNKGIRISRNREGQR